MAKLEKGKNVSQGVNEESTSKENTSLGKKILYVLGGLSFLRGVYLTKINHDLKETLADTKNEAAYNAILANANLNLADKYFTKYDSACRVNDYAWDQLNKELKTDVNALAKSKELQMKTYQAISKDIEKKMIGDVEGFVKAIRENFEITAVEHYRDENWVGYDINIQDKTGESRFVHDGKEYSCSIDSAKNIIRCVVTDIKTGEKLGTVDYNAIQFYGVTDRDVNSAYITLISEKGREWIMLVDGKLIEAKKLDCEMGGQMKEIYWGDKTCTVKNEDGRIRIFDAKTGMPLQGYYEAPINLGDDIACNFEHGFPQGAGEERLEGNNIRVGAFYRNGRPIGQGTIGYPIDYDENGPVFNKEKFLFSGTTKDVDRGIWSNGN